MPQVQLLNASFVSVQGASQGQDRARSGLKIKLDCRVTGFPAPWIEWYKNGRLLRNGPRVSLRTSRWRRKQDVRLSRLELELAPGRNETGLYECRAMSVVAREPVVGTYTLLVLPAQYALVPMQPELVAAARREPQKGAAESSTPAPTTAPTPSRAPEPASSTQRPAKEAPATNNSIHQEWPVVGQQCPREAHDNFCLNKGTCVLIGHIEEYYCK